MTASASPSPSHPSHPHADGSPMSNAELRQYYRAEKTAQIDKYRSNGKIDVLMRHLARNADRVLTELWHDCKLPGMLTLIAVGGYGRGELAPHSDIDILVLLPAEPDEALVTRLERFIGSAWDAGLDVGSSVRTIEDCIETAQADITIQTALLESRRIVGNTQLFERFTKAFQDCLDPRAFFQAKLLELRQRHAKYQDTPYSLEPNCKESPGGLRDLQVIVWMARAAGFGSTWQELEQSGLITEHEAHELRRNEFFLKTLRARLHILANRRQDVLVFDLQTALAEAFGYRASASRRASEPLMRRYYWAAKAVTQLSTILVQNIDARLNPDQSGITRVLSPNFVEKQGMIEIVSDDLFEREPTAILEAFLLYEKIQGVKGLSARTLRALYHSRRSMTLTWRRNPENRRLFLEILKQPSGITHALRLMNQTSVLGSYLTNFGRIVGQMQHDLYHVFTVDQHILTVLRNIRRFGSAEHTHEYPFCSELFANFERPWVLYIAALFHDIAKGRGGDHSTLGMVDARRFCREHGVEENDTALIVWLVEHHLTMSQVAQKQDTSDPDVIKAFADTVATERRLTALYLLTVADIRGTSPKVWNAWKGKLLENLYRLTYQVLGGAAPDADTDLIRRRDAARAALRHRLVSPDAEKPLWDQLDVSYFLRHDPDEIAWQTQKLLPHLMTERPIVRARPSPIGEGLQVLVYSKDRPDLFASICGYFSRQGLSVQQAVIHTTRHGYALDDFLVLDPDREATNLDNHRDIANLVEQQLSQQLEANAGLPEPVKGRLSRLSRVFPISPRIDLRPDERGQYFILSVSANDRAGLLYTIARILAQHRIGVRSARIHTLGDRVEDVFLIQSDRLVDSRLQLKLETELLDTLAI